MHSSSEITFTLLISECVNHTPLHRLCRLFVNLCNSVERETPKTDTILSITSCFIGGTLQAITSYHTSFSCRSIFLPILSSFGFIWEILCVFSVNKIGHHRRKLSVYATWTTDLIFDSYTSIIKNEALISM